MRNRNAAVSGLTIAAVAFVGACADVPPTQPMAQIEEAPNFSRQTLFGSQRQAGSESLRSLDAEFARLAREIPGFGGLYFDEAGNLNVVMAGEQQVVSTAQLAGALGRRLQAMGLDAAELQGLVVRHGRYDFTQLHAWHQRLLPLFGMVEGVILTDADEVQNRLRIGIRAGVSVPQIEQALQQLGIPREAVIFEVTEPLPLTAHSAGTLAPYVNDSFTPRSGHTLQDRVRPVAGGLQITFQDGEQTRTCTVGFNVRAPGTAVQGFTTSSGCTQQWASVDFTQYWQGSPSVANDLIGIEVFDPPFHDTGGHCFWPQCRWSAVAGIFYVPGVNVAFGRIYRTLFPGTTEPGSIEIDPDNPRFRIVDEVLFPLVGQTLHKMGSATGWTMGPVTDTCVNSLVPGEEPLTVLPCNDWVEAAATAGDHGAPVFARIGDTNEVRLFGLLWRNTPTHFVFSAMENIRFEAVGPRPWVAH